MMRISKVIQRKCFLTSFTTTVTQRQDSFKVSNFDRRVIKSHFDSLRLNLNPMVIEAVIPYFCFYTGLNLLNQIAISSSKTSTIMKFCDTFGEGY
jgi:hypothetical protein